jgi:thiamine-phosphate pyrophosphorylase
MAFALPKVYPILDSACIPAQGRVAFLERLGQSLAEAGVGLLEYRNKPGTDAQVLLDARVLRAVMPLSVLILDDRVDVAMAAGCNGVHVDAGDLPLADARSLMGSEAILGTSAASEAQLAEALAQMRPGLADYIAFGPVFPTTTKQTSAAPIGIDGVRRFRALAGPIPKLVAAAGITLETAPAVLEAGADCVAVSAAIFHATNPAAEFRRWIAVLGDREG